MVGVGELDTFNDPLHCYGSLESTCLLTIVAPSTLG